MNINKNGLTKIKFKVNKVYEKDILITLLGSHLNDNGEFENISATIFKRKMDGQDTIAYNQYRLKNITEKQIIEVYADKFKIYTLNDGSQQHQFLVKKIGEVITLSGGNIKIDDNDLDKFYAEKTKENEIDLNEEFSNSNTEPEKQNVLNADFLGRARINENKDEEDPLDDVPWELDL